MPEAGATLNKVIWWNSALGHLRSIRAYIEQFNPKAAQELAATLVAAGNSLENFASSVGHSLSIREGTKFMSDEQFARVWDAIEDTPAEAENMNA